MTAKVIAFPVRKAVSRAFVTDGASYGFRARFAEEPTRYSSADAEIQADRIAVHVPFASALIDAEQARELACKLLLLAVRLDERKADK